MRWEIEKGDAGDSAMSVFFSFFFFADETRDEKDPLMDTPHTHTHTTP